LQKRSGGSFLGIDAKQPCCAAGLRLVMVKPGIYYAPIRKRIGGWLHRVALASGRDHNRAILPPTRSSSACVMCLIVLLDVWQLRLLFTSFREIHISVMSASSRERVPARSTGFARHETIPSQVH
jgi:hypothetical protein